MAIYHCSMKPVGRASGKSAVAAAAYRAGECLINERNGVTHDFTRRAGVVYAEIVVPEDVEAAWAQDRSALWNAAERAENRKDARVAREFEIALPHELDGEQRLALTRSFAAELANRYSVAVDLAIHEPGSGTDIRNHHAHLLMTTREIGDEGFGDKASIEWKNARLLSQDMPTAQMQLRELRQAWEDHANEHLARAGHEARIDHRSHLERGLELDQARPMPAIERLDAAPAPALEPANRSLGERVASFFGRSQPETERVQDEILSHQRLDGRSAAELDGSGPEPKSSVAQRIEQRMALQKAEPEKTRERDDRSGQDERSGHDTTQGTIQERLQALQTRESRPGDIIRERQIERERDRERGDYER